MLRFIDFNAIEPRDKPEADTSRRVDSLAQRRRLRRGLLSLLLS